MKLVDAEKLRTLHNYAKDCGVSYFAIYKRIERSKLEPEIIDGVMFVDINKYPPCKRKLLSSESE